MSSVLISGASRGLGRAIALEVARRGATVFAGVRTEAAAVALRAETPLIPVRLDVRDAASIAAAVTEVCDRTGGRLDAVVHNAGIAVGGAFEDVPDAAARDVFETNVFGVFALTRQVLPVMRAQGHGRIVVISSSAGALGNPALSLYASSKWALEGWAESIVVELASVGISLCMVEPGPYRSDIFAASPRHRPPDSAYAGVVDAVERHVDTTVSRQAGDPTDVAVAVADLLDAQRPRFRTPVGRDGRLAWAMRGIVPWSVRQRIVRRVLKLPAPAETLGPGSDAPASIGETSR